MFAVVFKRVDKQPDEVYYYKNENDAVYHFELFIDDDSGLYSKISLLKVDEQQEIRYNILTYYAMI